MECHTHLFGRKASSERRKVARAADEGQKGIAFNKFDTTVNAPRTAVQNVMAEKRKNARMFAPKT